MQLNRRLLLASLAASAFPAIGRALSIAPHVSRGTLLDVEHVVILTQENRSFDHYFGVMEGVQGFSDRHPAPAPSIDGRTRDVLLQYDGASGGPRWLSPFPLDTTRNFGHMRVESTPHSWDDAQAAWSLGKMDRWPEAKKAHSLGYYSRDDIPFQYALADAFTLCDAYFCSTQTGTNPNRVMLWSGTIDGKAEFGGPCIGNSHDRLPKQGETLEPYRWTTYVERLQAAGVDWRIYQDMADNFTNNPLVGFEAFRKAIAKAPGSNPELVTRGLTTRALAQLKADVLSNSLPQVSYVIATAAGSEHPSPSSPAQGAAYTAQVIEALTANPEVWARTVLLVNFDENDGFFDHVPPPAPPSRDRHGQLRGASTVDLTGEYHDPPRTLGPGPDTAVHRGRPYGLGPRVPMYVISPWSTGGRICSEVFDHTSVIRFLEARFGVVEPNISPWRRAVCGDLTSCFDFSGANAASFSLPETGAIAKRAAAITKRVVPPTPKEPLSAVQQVGFRPACPSVYWLECLMAPTNGDIGLEFVNRGTRAAVFHVYNRLDLESGPLRYTVGAGRRVRAAWPISPAFDLQVMGPEGFHRRFEGTRQGNVSGRLFMRNKALILGLTGHGVVRAGPSARTETIVVQGSQKLTFDWIDANRRYDLVMEQTGSRVEFAGRAPSYIPRLQYANPLIQIEGTV